jgi:trehalose 6-phosphate phosphatase
VLDADATIARLTAHPERTALLVDFDGSLSPIVERAELARPLPEAVAVLDRLAAALGRVGIVSGRPVDFLAAQVPVERLVLTGLYGMETRSNGEHRLDPRVEPYREAVADAVAELRRRLPDDLIEPKSSVSVTLHWRPAPERADEILAVANDVAPRFRLGLLRTRMAIELRPPVDIDKGAAVRALVDGFDVAGFGGDDTGDLPAFNALARAARDGSLREAVRIGVHSPEAPPELVEAVDILVDGPRGLVALLTRVADEIA